MNEPVAIVGLGCRFPGAPDPASYWELLSGKRNAVGAASPPRWSAAEVQAELGATTLRANIGWGGFLPDIDLFDPRAFGISPREAREMDPQQRLLLEVAAEAMEDAGEPLGGPTATGVFVGISGNDYSFLKVKSPRHYATTTAFTGTGNTNSIAANRISYLFDLRGPSLAIDTACSSSLVAVHLAMRAIRDDECRMALAGGVNLVISPEVSIAFARAHMLSPTGQCWTFDHRADGYVRGEGCGVVVLKKLSDAQRDGNRILALLHGSAVNQDGYTRGITAPNVDAQEGVIRKALAAAAVDPDAIDFIEAHGSGTPIGDPAEIEALARVFGVRSGNRGPLPLGSVKANIGHLETASGVAGLIKVLLALRHERLPPQVNFESANAACKFDGALEVLCEERAWPAAGRSRYAGISNFGFGGTNSHVVIGDAPQPAPPTPQQDGWHVVTISTRNHLALPAAAASYAARIDWQDASLADIARTSTEGRAHHPFRSAFVVSNAAELRTALQRAAQAEPPPASRREAVPRIAFLFTGQGAQYAGMARDLYDREPCFRDDLDRCDELFRGLAGSSLLGIMFAAQDETAINQTCFAQPALLALEVSLARLWRRWGIVPHAVCGHGVGELAAACDAGMLTLEDAMRLVTRRGGLMQDLPPDGGMIGVGCAVENLDELLSAHGDSLALAAVNGPHSAVLSGTTAAVAAASAALRARDVPVMSLAVSHAFHSALMEPALAALCDAAAGLNVTEGQALFVSCLTGTVARADELADPRYWGRQARQCVRFADAIHTLQQAGCDGFIEIGPQPHLTSLAGSVAEWTAKAHFLPSLWRGRDSRRVMRESVSELYARGAALDWKVFNRGVGRRISLPPSPFIRESYWAYDALRNEAASPHPATS
jgi:acyl transferase domain-containing protein